MKKNEMIERLRCFLSEEQGCRKVSSYAEMIIEFLEGEGMQPPKVEKWEEISGTFLGEGFKVMKIVSEWEPEEKQ
jgi:hypothetical protein